MIKNCDDWGRSAWYAQSLLLLSKIEEFKLKQIRFLLQQPGGLLAISNSSFEPLKVFHLILLSRVIHHVSFLHKLIYFIAFFLSLYLHYSLFRILGLRNNLLYSGHPKVSWFCALKFNRTAPQSSNSRKKGTLPVSISSAMAVPLLLDAIPHLLAGKTLKTTGYRTGTEMQRV